MTCLLLIVLNVQYLGSYSTLFIFSGWLITCSWFLGYVDVLTVLIMVLISKNINKNDPSFIKIGVYFLFLSLNHNAISFAVSIIYLILANKNIIVKLCSSIIASQLIGNLLIQYYLNLINFSGRGRLRFVFNDNIIEGLQVF